MAGACEAPGNSGFIRGVLATVDCNVRGMSEAGYAAISAPNSPLAFALTTMLTIYVALFGLRLLLGLAPLRVGNLTLTAIKLGLVVALATNWAVYQQLVFNVLFRGPEQIAASLMGVIQPADSLLRGNPYDSLQIAFDELQQSVAFFARISQPTASPLSGGTAFAAFSLNMAAFLMAFATVGVVLAAKIVLAMLLAVGPLFIAMFMFETTRGLFEGWLRAALVFSLAPLFATLTLVVQLTFLEPQLVLLADMRASGEPNLPAASAAFMLVLVASAVSFSAFLGVGLLAASFKLPAKPAAAPAPAPSDRPAGASIIANPVGMHAAAAQLSQPRVAAIAAAVAAMERRDQRGRYDHAASGHPARAPSGYGAGQTAERRDYARSARRASPRRAASQARRDA